ncbi:MAG: putative porin [Bacteroidota bacterium]
MIKKIFRVVLILLPLLIACETIASGNVIYPLDTIPVNDTLPPPGDNPIMIPPEMVNDTMNTSTGRDGAPEEKPASAIPWYTEEQLQNPFSLKPNYIDTTLKDFQHYDFAARSGLFYGHKGNIGLTYRYLVYDPLLDAETDFGQYHNYGRYIFRHENLRFYRPEYVFTDLSLVTGTGREQMFYALHNQKIQENFYMGLQYRVINSPGSYSRLGARNSNVYLTGDYLSENKRYQVLGSFILNHPKSQESGGLRNPDAFEEDPVRDSVFLYTAESRYRDISLNLRHFYQTGFYTGGDSVSKGRFVNLGRINHNFTYQRFAFIFEETTSPYGFYQNPPVYETGTFDSTVVNKVENLISWSNFPLESGRGNFPFNFKFYLKQSFYSAKQPNFPSDAQLTDSLGSPLFYYSRDAYNQFVPGAELKSDENRLISFGGYANLTVGGYNDEDVHAAGYVHFGRPEQKYSLEGRLRFSSMEAPYFFNRFSGNYIQWENDFDKMQIVNIRGRLQSPWVDLEGNYYLLNNVVYMGEEAVPVQNNIAMSFFSLGAYSDLEGRFLGLRNHVVLQQATSERFDRFPGIISYHSFYVKMNWFEGALIHRAGVDFHFNTGYKAMSFMPVVREFYAQNTSVMRPKYLVDVFWSAKIKRARLFVKYQHMLGLIPDFPPHYDIPYYPHPDGMFKFGVSWMFYN